MLSLMIHARRSTSPAQLWLPGPCLDRTMNTVIARVNQIGGVAHPMFLLTFVLPQSSWYIWERAITVMAAGSGQ